MNNSVNPIRRVYFRDCNELVRVKVLSDEGWEFMRLENKTHWSYYRIYLCQVLDTCHLNGKISKGDMIHCYHPTNRVKETYDNQDLLQYNKTVGYLNVERMRR